MKHQQNQIPYLELSKIEKHFGITKALQQLDLQIYAGEVIGLVGANGAGKSTLMKIVTGVLEPTSGEIRIKGNKMIKYTTKEAKEVGISCAYQDLSLCTNLSVYENFAMLNVNHKLLSKPGWREKAKKDTRELLDQYFPNNGIDVLKQVEHLSLAERQIVEICKTLMMEHLEILILDEPTSALSTDKAQQLHKVVKTLSDKGVAIIYISHKLNEIKEITDRIVMMKNGKNAGECDSDTITVEELIGLLGGESKKKERVCKQQGQQHQVNTLVELKHYTTSQLKDINMHVKQGEIVGISGLVGSGQVEILDAIFSHAKGVELKGSVSYVSGDRAKEGVFLQWGIFDNILIGNLDKMKKGILLDKKVSEETAKTWYDKLKFKAEGIHSPILSLSGGNQQKALIARGIASGADVIILNDPTAGVDIETKQDIYALLQEVKDQGKAVILYSTEDAEIEICDRAYIMHQGQIVQELIDEEITVPNIVKASFKEIKSNVKQEEKHKKNQILEAVFKTKLLLPVATMIVMILVNGYLNPRIMSYSGLNMLIGSAVPLVFAALGQMFIVVSGDIDMGNGYSIGLVNVLVAVVLTGNPVIGLMSLIVFVAAYTLMGALIHIRNIPAIVVTLGAQFVWLGVALTYSPTPGGSCPQWLMSIFKFNFPLIPMPIVICVIAAIVSYYILYRSKYGMILRGIGNNAIAVERSGWSYLIAKMTNYCISGIMVVLSGMAFTVSCLGSDANSATSYCMLSIATVIIGGCEMAGGKVEPIGVVAGAIAMSFITTLLTALKIDSNYQTAVTGIILIGVLAIKLLAHKKEGAKC